MHPFLHHVKVYLFLEAPHNRGGNEVTVSIWTCCKPQTDSSALPSPNVAIARGVTDVTKEVTLAQVCHN